MILEIVGVLRALDFVLGSPSLTPEEKRSIAAELKASMPAKMLCSKAQNTHDIITGLLSRSTAAESAEEARQDSKAEDKLLRKEEGVHGIPGAAKAPQGGPQKVAGGKPRQNR